MKYLFNTVTLFIALLFLGCSLESVTEEMNNKNAIQQDENSLICIDAGPQYQFTNNGTVSFTLDVYNTDGDLIFQDVDVQPGGITDLRSFISGETLFSFDSNVNGVSDFKVVFDMINCSEIQFVIDASNNLENSQPSIL